MLNLAKIFIGKSLNKNIRYDNNSIVNLSRDIWENSLMILVNLSQHSTLRPSLGNAGKKTYLSTIRNCIVFFINMIFLK